MSYTIFDKSNDSDGYFAEIKWNDEFVVGFFHPWMTTMALRELEKMGGPCDQRNGIFSQEVSRRVNRLHRAVPCHGPSALGEPGCNAGVGQPCKRPSGHETYLGVPHAPRVEAFDRWLIELADEMGFKNNFPSLDDLGVTHHYPG
jgi:hypothetical protein|tara:strand:- start:1716 stop:2150 length:435 start_codon:yes stop_codon:yes gene_type:complete